MNQSYFELVYGTIFLKTPCLLSNDGFGFGFHSDRDLRDIILIFHSIPLQVQQSNESDEASSEYF